MTDARRAQLRSIMKMAWSFFRSEPGRGFADCLRGAWMFIRNMDAFAKKARWGRGRKRRVCFNSLIASPVEKAVRSDPYARTEARDRSRLTSALGC